MGGGKFALLIGASQFDDDRLSRLAAPKNDVDALEAVLRDHERCGFSEVSSLLNHRLEDVQQALSDILDANHARDDLVLIYYTGHGIRDDRGHLYFTLKGTNADSPHVGSIEAAYLKRGLERCTSRRQVLILDCCHAGAYLDGERRALGGATINETTFDPNGYGRFVLAASASDESAFEKDGASLYTRHIVDALQTGDAAPDREFVTVHDVHNYVARQVRAQGTPQRPRYWADVETEVIQLARNPDVRLPLPAHLGKDLIAENRTTRRGAIAELSSYLNSSNPAQREEANRLLEERLIDDAEDSVSLVHDIRRILEIPNPEERIPQLEIESREAESKNDAGELLAEVTELREQEGEWAKDRQFWLKEEARLIEKIEGWESELKLASATKNKWPLFGLMLGSVAVVAISALVAIPKYLSVNNELTEVRHTLTQARAKLQPTVESNKALEGQITELEASLVRIQNELADKETHAAALQNQVDMVQSENANTDTGNREDIQQLESRIAEHEQRASDLQALLGEQRDRNNELEDQLAQAKIAKAGSDLSSFRDDLGGDVRGPEMVVIPAGSFMMGSPKNEKERSDSEGPQRSVTVARFALSRTEITFDDWQACVDGGGCKGNPRPNDRGWGRVSRPVINVSWDDVREYVQWLNGKVGREVYRLPSESEWEYAARAGKTTPFWTGETISTDQANYNGNSTYGSGRKGLYREKTVPVGSLNAPNAFGLHDVHGNVWEWVDDCWHADYSGAPPSSVSWQAASSGDCSLRVLRGGSWSNYPRNLRSAIRSWLGPGGRNLNVGFRLARTLTP